MDLSGNHVVVTGGTGALGTAVVNLMIGAGATCIVPYVHDAEEQSFPYRGQPAVTLVKVADLANEDDVAKVFAAIKSPAAVWASIHIAGGFAAGKIGETGKSALMAQIDG